ANSSPSLVDIDGSRSRCRRITQWSTFLGSRNKLWRERTVPYKVRRSGEPLVHIATLRREKVAALFVVLYHCMHP
uniref:Uncharacterized protein n=1 Tax=Aegilops tauschii subsp. strangulata TaxID=200361 RepID=A0A453CJE7_AEGTS